MSERVLRLRHPTNTSARLAIVSLQRGDKPGAWVVTVARGERRTKLVDSRLYGPFSLDEGEQAWRSMTTSLEGEGYLPSGVGELLAILQTSKSPRLRARAADKLGWRRERRGVDALIARAEKPKDDIATITVALGRIGDPRAIPTVRAEAERKLLSRRRAGVESLRLLGDGDGLAAARTRTLERLPDVVRARLLTSDESKLDAVASVVATVAGLEEKERGSACDALYELGSPLASAAARTSLLALDVSQPHVWRYVKSVIKRAATRTDGETFGALLHAVEKRGRTTTGTTAKLKSGLDGEVKSTRVFSRKTVDWVRRAAWRFLRMLARWRPADYALFAAWCVAPYSNDDDVQPQKRLPSIGRSYLLARVLLGASPRFVVDSRRVRVLWKGQKATTPPPGGREEAFASLWDLPTSTPAFHVLLGRARHRLAVKLAVDAVTRRPEILETASTEDLARMLASPDDRLSDLAFTALRLRFNPQKPDVDAILALGGIDNDRARQLSTLWLQAGAHIWSRDADLVARLLSGPLAVREPTARLVLLSLPSSSPALRAALADRLLVALDAVEPFEGAFSSWAEIARALSAELPARCPPERALQLLERHDAGAAVAAAVFAGLPDPFAVLGAAAIVTLAASEQAARRAVAIAALTTSAAAFREQLSLTLTLAEGEWDDVRAACVQVLRGLDERALDLPRWMAILDATQPAVQDVGKELLQRRLAASAESGAGTGAGTDVDRELDLNELLGRLAQHPHRNIRAFVVDLAVQHLRPGYVRLARLESLARAALFDVRPDRPLRRRLIAFLLARGQLDESQAELACAVLGDVVRSRTHDARDDAAAAIALLQLCWPGLQLPDHVVVEVSA